MHLAAAALALVAVLALPASAAESGDDGKITVTSRGSVSTVPVEAEWSFGVYSEGKTAGAALRMNSSATSRVIAVLKTEGVDPSDLRTEQVYLAPRWSNGTLAGYSASNSVRVTAGWEKAASLIDMAVTAGANRVYGPLLTREQSDDLYQRALANAVEKAREKARGIAQSAGLTLGRPLVISEIAAGGYVPYAYGVTASSSTPPGVPEQARAPLEPGQREVQATVTVTFAAS